MKLLYQDETNAAQTALNQNIRVMEKISDHYGYANPLVLGYYTPRHERPRGDLDELAVYDWDGTNLQMFYFGSKGDGKSVNAEAISQQLYFYYGCPKVNIDRKNEYHCHEHPLTEPKGVQLLRNWGFTPLGYGDKQENLIPKFIKEPYHDDFNHQLWTLTLRNMLRIDEDETSKVGLGLLERTLGIDQETKTSEDKYAAAREGIEIVINEYDPQTLEELIYQVIEYQMNVPSHSRSNSLIRKLRNLKGSRYLDEDYPVDFERYLNPENHLFLNILTSTTISKNPFLQAYESYLHFYIYNYRMRTYNQQGAKPICVLSDEHDVVASAGSEQNELKDAWARISKKERFASNLYFKITQTPYLINREEISQADFIITSKPRDDSYLNKIKEFKYERNMREILNYLDTDQHPKQKYFIGERESFPYYPLPTLSQYHIEHPVSGLNQINKPYSLYREQNSQWRLYARGG